MCYSKTMVTRLHHGRRTWLVTLALLAVVPVLYCSMFLPRDVNTWLIREERPIELLGVVGLLACCVACVALWRATRGDPQWPRLRRVALLGFAALLFFGAGEEESWGQRLLGIETPSSYKQINEQGETNLHNLSLFDHINSETLFSLLWFTLGVLVPVLALLPGPRRVCERILPILPVPLACVFVTNQVVFWGFDALFAHNPTWYDSEYPAVYTLVEIKETVAELALG